MSLINVNQLTTHKYYVYVFTDPRKPGKFIYGDFIFDHEPFYVGKGCGTRPRQHLKDSSLSAKYNIIKNGKLNNIIEQGFNPLDYCIIAFNNLTNDDALQKEMDVIKLIGRIISKNGPLSNLTDGGDGTSGYYSKLKGKTYEDIHGPEKAKLLKEEKSKRFTGNKNPMFGKPSYNRDKPMSEEVKKKLSDSRKKAVYKICKKTGAILKEYSCAKEASKDLGIGLSSLHNCLSPNYRSKSSAGFYWRYK